MGSAVDLTTSDSEMAGRVASVLGAHETRLAGLIGQGQEDSSIPGQIDPAATARLLLCVTQRMQVLGKTGRSQEEMASLTACALTVLR